MVRSAIVECDIYPFRAATFSTMGSLPIAFHAKKADSVYTPLTL